MLNNKRVVVTGAAGALGRAVAATAAARGAEVIGLDIAASAPLPGGRYHRVDLLDREATLACIGGLGGFDALLNVAGGFAMGEEAAAPSDEQWEQMFRVNVETLRNAVMAAVPVLRRRGGGAIVNVGALGAVAGQGGMSAYCCAKASVMRLTESLAEELKASGINVNAVLPSIIDTPANREAMPEADFSAWVAPDKLAEVMCFLASDAAGAVHGALIPVRGLA